MSSNWIDRMNNMEATPPETGWDKVAAALDESLNGLEFPGKLYDAAIPPAANVWSAIENKLDPETTPVIPIQRKSSFPSILRYAVAASVIGLIAFGAFRFLGNKADSNTATVTTDTLTPGNTGTVTTPSSPQTTIGEQQPPVVKEEEDEAMEQSKQTYAKLDLSKRNSYNKLYRSPAQLASFISDDESSAKAPQIEYSHRAAVNDSPVDDADRYVMYRDTDGRFIRISKKLSELFCCVSGEVQDEKCTSQLKQWREKIAASPFNPSPDNFMDILDLINSIQDNRN